MELPRFWSQIFKKKHILIASFPRSGSTYLTMLLRMITGFRGAGLTQFYGNEQDVYEYKLIKHSKKNTVSGLHVRGTKDNVNLLKKYDIKPVVHTRNIFDVVVSLKDHLVIEGPRSNTGYVPKEYSNMTEEEKFMFLVRVHLPWYFNFLVSWSEVSETFEVLWTSYEKLFEDQVGTVGKIMAFYDLPFTTEQIKNGLNRVKPENTRFNVGVKGRGEQLSQEHKRAIYDLARAWKMKKSLRDKMGID